MAKLICILTLVLCLAGCSRQHHPQPAATTTALAQGTNAAQQPAAPASNPAAPVAVQPQPDQPLPAQPAPDSSAQSSQPAPPSAGTSAPPAPAQTAQANPPLPPVTGEPVVDDNTPSPPPASPPPQTLDTASTLVIPAGSRIRVRLAQRLSTKFSYAGERFTAHLDAPIVSAGRVIVPRGTVFYGRVTAAKRSGRLKGRAHLGLTLISFRLHGVVYPVATTSDFRSSSSHKRRNLALIGGGSGFGTAVGAVAGGGVGALIGAGAGAAAGTTGAFITGKKNVKLPAETPLTFALRRSVSIRS